MYFNFSSTEGGIFTFFLNIFDEVKYKRSLKVPKAHNHPQKNLPINIDRTTTPVKAAKKVKEFAILKFSLASPKYILLKPVKARVNNPEKKYKNTS